MNVEMVSSVDVDNGWKYIMFINLFLEEKLETWLNKYINILNGDTSVIQIV